MSNLLKPVTAGAAATVALLFTACGADDDIPSGFCSEVWDLDQEYTGNDDDVAFASELAELDPPDEIADEWQTVVADWPEFSDPDEEALEAEPEDIEAAEELEERAAEFERASRAVVSYLRDDCGFDLE